MTNNILYKSTKEMYDTFDLSKRSIFQGGYINYGYWESKSFDENSCITENERVESSLRLYQKTSEKLSIDKSDCVLEIGCGRGIGAHFINTTYQPAQYIGIDFVASQVKRARNENKFYLSHNSTLSFAHEDIHSLSYKCELFNKILSVESAIHFNPFEDAISEIYRVLKKPGIASIATIISIKSDNKYVIEELIPLAKDAKVLNLIPIQQAYGIFSQLGFKKITIESIGEYVFCGFDVWAKQVGSENLWTFNLLKAYKKGLIDYVIITIGK